MSKFAYKSEGELNSQYLIDLLKEYLDKLLQTNDTKGIEDKDYKIDPQSNAFAKKFNDVTTRIFRQESTLNNYNKVVATRFVNHIKKQLDIFLQTNVLTPIQFTALKQTLSAINFGKVIPLIDISREDAINKSQKRFLKVLKDVKYLQHSYTEYILFNSPVMQLKPFLSDKVSVHTLDYFELQKLIKQLVEVRYMELTNFSVKPKEFRFVSKVEDFYKDNITDNGVGEDVEKFIRSKMTEKLQISKQTQLLPEEINAQIAQIDTLLKKLKVHKIEKMLYDLIILKTNLAQVKEVMETCKETINKSTMPNKAQMFLMMDDLYYKLSKRCETLQQKAKLKLQLVDKQKLFATLEMLEKQQIEHKIDSADKIFKTSNKKAIHTSKMQNNANVGTDEGKQANSQKQGIASNLYDDDDTNEIHITEDDGDSDAEDEIIIDEDK